MFTNDPIKFKNLVDNKLPLLALDPGTKLIGIAISDINKKIAKPMEVLEFKKYNDLKEKLLNIIIERKVGGIVIGNPINMDGSIGPRSQSSNSLADNLSLDLKLPILLWDERLSTSAAEKLLIEADLSRKKRSTIIDKIAASFILQGYLHFINNKPRIIFSRRAILHQRPFLICSKYLALLSLSNSLGISLTLGNGCITIESLFKSFNFSRLKE